MVGHKFNYRQTLPGIALCVCISAIAGCGERSSSHSSGGVTSARRFGDLTVETSVAYGHRSSEYGSRFNNGAIFIIWTDVTSATKTPSSGVSGGSFDTHWNGEFPSSDGDSLKWECSVNVTKQHAAGTGTMTINDVKHDLADGAVFLVTIKDGSPIIKQLKRDISGITGEDASLNTLAQDPEIKAFFAEDQEAGPGF